MTLFILAYIIPFALILTICLWGILHRSPLERCKRLFVKIANHPEYKRQLADPKNPFDVPALVRAVKDEDEAYLKERLKSLGKP